MRFTNEGTAGSIVVATAMLGRYSAFEVSLEQLIVPVGTKLIRARGGSSARNQNLGVRQRQGEWVWFIDDDHTFEPDVLMRLLAHEKEIIAPLVPMRFPPFDFVLYKTLDIVATPDHKVSEFREAFYSMADLKGVTGLMEVQGLPKAGCLVRESLWSRMPDPWFRIGLIHPDDIEDDKYFMWEARERYGYTLWCDTDQVINHLTTVSIGARREKDGSYKQVVIL